MAQDPYKYFRVEARELVDQLGKGLLDLEKGGAQRRDGVAAAAPRAHAEGRGARRQAAGDRRPRARDRGRARALPRHAAGNVAPDVDQRRSCGGSTRSPAASPRCRRQARRRRKPARARGEPAPPEESFRTVRTEVEEIDALVDGVSETFARLNALREHGRARSSAPATWPNCSPRSFPRAAAKGQLPAALRARRPGAVAGRGASRDRRRP